MKPPVQITRTYKEIEHSHWSCIPDPQDKGLLGGEIWMWPRVRCHFQINPTHIKGETYLHFPYAVSVFDHHGKHILSAVLEQTDYRELALLTGESYKSYTGKSGKRFSDISAIVYSAEDKKDFGVYEEALEPEAVRDFLLSLVADELDLVGMAMYKGRL